MKDYLKYYLTPFLLLLGYAGIFYGTIGLWFGFISMVGVVLVGDLLAGDDFDRIDHLKPKYLNIPLYLALPMSLTYVVLVAWSVSDTDFLSIGKAVSAITGYDVLAARENNQWYHYLGAVISSGFAVASFGTNVAHELMHRVHSKTDVLISRWLMALTMNSDFVIEHVWGHHVNVSTDKDPASAKEGENLYPFFIRSSIYSFISAWNIEKKRLERKKQSVWSLENKFIVGQLIQVALISLFYLIGGIYGVLLFLAQALFGKFILETVNYLEHYGLQRNVGERVAPHHSWNSNNRMSGIVLFFLNRHSSHHEKGMLPFWKLEPYKNSPELPHGYLVMLFMAMVPPVWYAVMNPRVANWRKQYQNQMA